MTADAGGPRPGVAAFSTKPPRSGAGAGREACCPPPGCGRSGRRPRPRLLRRQVLVDAGEDLAPSDSRRPDRRRVRPASLRRREPETPAGSVGIVMGGISGKDPVKVAPRKEEGPVQDLGANGPHPALGVRVGLGERMGVRMTLAPSDPNTAPKERVNLESRSRIRNPNGGQVTCHGEVPSLLGGVASVGIAGRGHHVDPTGSDLDEEQDVERLKEGGLDGEEVTGQYAKTGRRLHGLPRSRTQRCVTTSSTP